MASGSKAKFAEHLLAVEKLRGELGLPRHVFIRPPAEALARTDGFARQTDVKPMYIDLESCLMVDLLVRQFEKYPVLEVTEMLPSPDELIWREPSGHFCFELRTLIEPI